MGSTATITGDIRTKADPSDVQLYYFMKNRDGNIVVNGITNPSSDLKFQITLSKSDTSKLSDGPNQLKLFAISNTALKPDIYTTSIIGLPSQLVDEEPAKPSEPIEQSDISIAIKHKKKVTLLAVKNEDEKPVFGVEIKITDGSIKFVKARGWDRERVDQSTVIVQTADRPIDSGKSLIVLMIVDNKEALYEWSAFNNDGITIASGNASVR